MKEESRELAKLKIDVARIIKDAQPLEIAVSTNLKVLRRIDEYTEQFVPDEIRNSDERELIKVIRSKNFYKSRIEEIQNNLSEFPEPYKTMLSNIIANGTIRM